MNNKLKFRLVAYPKHKNDRKQHQTTVENSLKSCNFTIHNCNISQVWTMDKDQTKDQTINRTPIILQEFLFLEVSGSTNTAYSNMTEQYKYVYEMWLSSSGNKFPSKEVPWLMITDNQAFIRSWNNEHVLKKYDLMFGSIISLSQFICHQEFKANILFSHDVRKLKIQYSDIGQPGSLDGAIMEKIMILDYSFIRHILVSHTGLLIVYISAPVVLNIEETNRVDSSPIDRNVLGKSNSLYIPMSSMNMIQSVISRLHIRCNNISISFVPVEIVKTTTPTSHEDAITILNSVAWVRCFSFNCRYMIEALIRKTFILQLQCLESFLTSIKNLSDSDNILLDKCLIDLLLLTECGYPINLRTSCISLFNYNQKENSSFSSFVPPKTKQIRSVVITPTRILLWPAEIVVENRIIRHFDSEYSLRVSFREDNFSKLSYKYPTHEVVNYTIRDPMMKGLNIAGRHYEFLAWSNSQLRDHNVWMYARDDSNHTSASIRKWMGNFSRIKCVPKYMARMGQCFSKTYDSLGIPMTNKHVIVEPDIKRCFDHKTKKMYCFSDGIGRISQATVTKICASQGITKEPSAFQIRYGGCKGMLVLDPTLKNKDIVLRESMVKFDSDQERLEIVKYSTANRVSLNRPMVAILDHVGISSEVLLRMQEDTLQTLTEMLLDSEKAASYLTYRNNILRLDYQSVLDCGIDLASEPFFRAMLLASHYYDVGGLRKKNRLPIDPSQGRNMFGALDETATLQYGQVFVQYTTNIFGQESNSQTTILKGKVLVTKNPCHQPGDVRIFESIDVPALHHIVDCIVFPQLGKRPHPNEMSGSDLDGDEYTVIWKNDLIFGRNFPAGQFPSPKLEELKRKITLRDMVEFLCKFIMNDRIGFIASTHLAISDEFGIDSEIAQEVAFYCSIAVDFPKSGVEVKLGPSYRPIRYPDYMEKRDKESYKSRKVLGKLFRVCRDFQNSSADVCYTYPSGQVDSDFEYQDWQNFKSEAEKSLYKYKNFLEQLLNIYGVKHESEAMCGAFSTIHSRFQETKDKVETKELVAIYIQALWKQTQDEFFEEFVHCKELPNEAILQKASAWYMVTYGQINPTILSFPWTISSFLMQIKLLNLAKRGEPVKPSLSPQFLKLNSELESQLENLPPISHKLNSLIQQCSQVVKLDTLHATARVLLHWAKEVGVLKSLNSLDNKMSFMTDEALVKLLLFVATKESKDLGVMPLIISFFKFCMSLRFLDINQRKEILPFPIPRQGLLSKQAMLSYRDLAIKADLSALCLGGEVWHNNELVEMEPIVIQKATVGSEARQCSVFRNLLLKWTGVSEVMIKSSSKQLYVINAHGPKSCVRILEGILNKGDSYLQKAILEKELPKSKPL